MLGLNKKKTRRSVVHRFATELHKCLNLSTYIWFYCDIKYCIHIKFKVNVATNKTNYKYVSSEIKNVLFALRLFSNARYL